ncbi:MAG: CoA pyrophosphatase [Ignavibacteriae bacterium]|nr:CoA pyrophosphatase [Ignavibacteriota bacterium]
MTVTHDHIRQFLARHTPRKLDSPGLTRAAVLIPMLAKDGALHVLFTKRTKTVEHHKGQISFPGGAIDAGDSDAVAAALREAEEEIGLPRASVDVLGVFHDYVTPSGYCVTPVAGYIAAPPQFVPSSQEVEEVFDVPLEFFLDARNEHIVKVMRRKTVRDVYFYNYGQHEIWGVTAAILRAFLKAMTTTAKTT